MNRRLCSLQMFQQLDGLGNCAFDTSSAQRRARSRTRLRAGASDPPQNPGLTVPHPWVWAQWHVKQECRSSWARLLALSSQEGEGEDPGAVLKAGKLPPVGVAHCQGWHRAWHM